MPLSVIKLFGLKAPALQTSKAAYYIKLTNRAPKAYLHTVFKGLPEHVLHSSNVQWLKIPIVWQNFLQIQNGANLFFNSLYLYGVLGAASVLNRTASHIEYPFGIEDQNVEANLTVAGEWLLIGSYGFDGSQLRLSRFTSRVQVTEVSHGNVLEEWSDAEVFLTIELKRLSMLFTKSGELLTNEKYTVPGTAPAV
jgi:hypothetical protein